MPIWPIVLIIDDSEEDSFLLGRDLQPMNVTPARARDCAEGIVMALSLSPKLIIIDMKMPLVDGIACVKILKRNARLKHIPVVAITGQMIPGVREEALAAGFEDYFEKPMRPTDLVSQLRAFIK